MEEIEDVKNVKMTGRDKRRRVVGGGETGGQSLPSQASQSSRRVQPEIILTERVKSE